MQKDMHAYIRAIFILLLYVRKSGWHFLSHSWRGHAETKVHRILHAFIFMTFLIQIVQVLVKMWKSDMEKRSSHRSDVKREDIKVSAPRMFYFLLIISLLTIMASIWLCWQTSPGWWEQHYAFGCQTRCYNWQIPNISQMGMMCSYSRHLKDNLLSKVCKSTTAWQKIYFTLYFKSISMSNIPRRE